MKYFELDKDEEQILADFDNGQLVSVKDLEDQKETLNAAATNSLNKTRNINIRLSERDVQKLKTRAAREGIPYQTLASSILHQSTGK